MPSMLPAHRVKPPFNIITIDLLLHILSRSIFHPAIILIFWLCLASVPPHHHRHALGTPTLYYASFLLFIRLLLLLNDRITNGLPRKVKWDEEVVVITGGGSGLGRCIAELLLVGKPGVKVAILDVKEPDATARSWMSANKDGSGGGEFEGRLWWGCIDIRNSAAVRIMAGRIKEELGKPTVVINNAACAVNGLPLVASGYQAGLSSQEVTRTVSVNLLGAFNVLNAFLGDILASAERGHGGTVVTVSSLLAHLSPAKLADYSASKAGLSSLHQTLTSEIASSSDASIRRLVKTVLVEPGQISTELFSDITVVPWYTGFLAPVLEVNEVAKAVVRMLEEGRGGVVRLPFYSKCMPLYGALPGSVKVFLRWFSGIDGSIRVEGRKRRVE